MTTNDRAAKRRGDAGRVCDRTQYDTMRQARYGTVGEGAIGSAVVTVLSATRKGTQLNRRGDSLAARWLTGSLAGSLAQWRLVHSLNQAVKEGAKRKEPFTGRARLEHGLNLVRTWQVRPPAPFPPKGPPGAVPRPTRAPPGPQGRPLV